MKNIKKFENFINERLDRQTYFSAAKQADERGHKKLGKALRSHSNELSGRERREAWDKKYGHLKKYKFNLIRLWTQEETIDEDGNINIDDKSFKVDDEARYGKYPFTFSGADLAETNLIMFSLTAPVQVENGPQLNEHTIMNLYLDDDKTLKIGVAGDNRRTAWFADRRSANQFLKLFKELYEMGKWDRWFEEEGVLDIDEIKYDMRNYFGE